MKMKIDPRREIYVYLCIGPNKLSYISRLNSWHIRHVVDLRRAHIQRRQCVCTKYTQQPHHLNWRCASHAGQTSASQTLPKSGKEGPTANHSSSSSSTKKILIWYRFLKSKNSPFCTIWSIWCYFVYPMCRQRWNIYECYSITFRVLNENTHTYTHISPEKGAKLKGTGKKRQIAMETTMEKAQCALAYLSYFPLFSHFIPYAMTVSPKIPISMPFT